METREDYYGSAAMRWYLEISFWVTAVIVFAMMVLVAYDAIARYLFGQSSRWIADTITIYLMAAITFLPAAWVLAKGRHPSVGLVLDRLRSRPRRVILVVNNVLALIYSLTLAWYGGWWTIDEFTNHYTFSTAIPFPRWPAACMVCVGGLMLIPVCVSEIVHTIRAREVVERTTGVH